MAILNAVNDEQGRSYEDMAAEIARLREQNERLKAARNSKLGFKVSASKGVSVYGLGRFPVTLYRGQWERLLEASDAIKAFIEANSDLLATKE